MSEVWQYPGSGGEDMMAKVKVRMKEVVFFFPMVLIDWLVPVLERAYEKMLESSGCWEDSPLEK